MHTQQTVGFIGFGAMGSRFGKHIKESGYHIAAYTPSGKGGDDSVPFYKTPKELAEHSDIVLVCVPDDEALSKSMYGPQGALAGMKPQSLLLNTSSISPPAANELFEKGRDKNIIVIDCPVSGSTPEADAGKVIVMAGGENQDIKKAQKIFDAIGRITIHTGPPTTGARLKLVINAIMGAGLVAVAESIAYGLAAGLDREMLFNALDEMAVISPHHKRKIRMGKEKDFTPQFPARLMQKDMRLFMDAVTRLYVPVPGMAAVTQQLSVACLKDKNKDYSVLIGALEDCVSNDR